MTNYQPAILLNDQIQFKKWIKIGYGNEVSS